MSEDCVCDFGKEKGSFTIEARSALRSERVFINTEIQYCTSFRNLIRKSQNPSWNLTRSHRSHRSVPASSGVPSSTPCARRLSQPLCNYSDSTGIRSRGPTAAPRDARHSPPPRTSSRPTGSRSRAPTVAPLGARPSPRAYTCPCSTSRRSRAPTAAPRDARPSPPSCTCLRLTVCRSRETPSTLRAVRSSPLPDKGIPDATGDLAVASASTRLNIQGAWLLTH